MTAPLNFNIRARESTDVQASPYRMVILGPAESGEVTATTNQMTSVTDSTAATLLGTTSDLRRWYDHIEARAAVDIAVLPYVASTNSANAASNAVSALDSLLNAQHVAAVGGPPDIVVAPNITGIGTGANSVVSKLETVCAHASVSAIAIVDAYHENSSPQNDVVTWQNNNSGADILAVTNQAIVGSNNEWGSVIIAGHMAQWSTSEGVGSHPFNLRHPISGIGTVTPTRVFSLYDGSAAAETLADAHLTSIILFDGADYAWGGRLNVSSTGDPREYAGNAVIANRMAKRSTDILARFIGRPISGRLLDTMAHSVERTLTAEFGTLVDGIVVPTATRVGSRMARVRPSVRFFGFVESITVNADVFIGA